MVNKKLVAELFSAKTDLSLCPNTYEFFLIFEKLVYRKMRRLFAKTYSNFDSFDRFFKTKKKCQRLEKNVKNSYVLN